MSNASAIGLAGAPRASLPPLSCDSHVHVIGHAARYAFDARRGYTPEPASLASYCRVAAACGIERAVLVQPSVYGADNACLLDALRDGASAAPSAAPELRGVVVPAADTGDAALEAMHALGVRGVRLNLVNPQVLAAADASSQVMRMRHRGWHLQVQLRLDAEGEAQLDALARSCDAPIVVDHFGRPPRSRVSPVLLALAAEGRVWVKLSAPYRASSEPGYADLRPLIDALIDAASGRLLWATDWPHTEIAGDLPRDEDLVDVLSAWLPDPLLRQQVCVDNPARLYDYASGKLT